MDGNKTASIDFREVRRENRPRTGRQVLMPYGERASDRAEVFAVGSLSWPDGGVVLRRQHNRQQPIVLKFTPLEVDGKLTVDAEIPSTAAGADCVAEIRSGLLGSMSVEFRAVSQSIVGGCRRITAAVLTGAGLVDLGSYESATVEARELAEAKAEWERWRREVIA